jgi:hypothetical protein
MELIIRPNTTYRSNKIVFFIHYNMSPKIRQRVCWLYTNSHHTAFEWLLRHVHFVFKPTQRTCKLTSQVVFMFAPCIFSIKILLLKSNKCTLLVASTLNKIKVTTKSYNKNCFVVTLILFRVNATSSVHLLDFNKRILVRLYSSDASECTSLITRGAFKFVTTYWLTELSVFTDICRVTDALLPAV